jgi:hypothetical protein
MCIKNDPHAGNKRWARSAAGPPPLRAAVGLRRDRRRLLMALALLFVVDIGFSARAAGERRAGIGSQARRLTAPRHCHGRDVRRRALLSPLLLLLLGSR